MASDVIANTARGVIFGAALTAAGVWSPKIIIDQMALKDFHMLKVFLTASASSALILAAFSKSCKPRQASNLGRLGPYDGNLLGGALIGLGMAVTGACPGTIFVQIATGIPSAYPTLAGALLGGVVYVGSAPYLKTNAAKVEKQDSSNLTVASRLKVDPNVVLLAFEALLVSALIAFTELQATPSYLVNPIIGGLGIGFSQFASMALSGQPLGISGAFEEIGEWFFWATNTLRGGQSRSRPSTKNIGFAGSVMAGAYLLSRYTPDLALIREAGTISPIAGFIGGIFLSLGSRIAGGCTSGHGISGMALLSVSSLLSVAAMFGAGIGARLLLDR